MISLTVAQFRMLGRAVRGEHLPLDRYNHLTVNALLRKKCVGVRTKWGHSSWVVTDVGNRVHAAGGKLAL